MALRPQRLPVSAAADIGVETGATVSAAVAGVIEAAAEMGDDTAQAVKEAVSDIVSETTRR